MKTFDPQAVREFRMFNVDIGNGRDLWHFRRVGRTRKHKRTPEQQAAAVAALAAFYEPLLPAIAANPNGEFPSPFEENDGT